MTSSASPERPIANRPFSFGRAAQWLLAAAAAPLYAAFVWESTLASMADDSVSYLLLARWFEGSVDGGLSQWLPWHTHFPPLFPMLLAAVGGARDLLHAHLAVAACAVASVLLFASYGARRLASEWGGFWLAAAFLVLPTAWLSAKSILSEPLYLALTLAALLAHARWIEVRRPAPLAAWLAFAALVALACSTRVAGFTLVAAFVLHEAVVARRARRLQRAALLPPLMALAAMVAWVLLRPGGDTYAQTVHGIFQEWLAHPRDALAWMLQTIPSAWVSTFLVEGQVAWPMRACACAIGIVAVAGSVRAAKANRLDGWYVLATLALAVAWTYPFGVENLRRIIYPVVPLLLLHAGELVVALVRRASIRHAYLAVAAICAPPLAASLPATLLIVDKARDREAFVPGSRYAPANLTDYFRLINRPAGLALAARHAATLGGLEALATATPPGARIMWMRPEYIALVGNRECVPQYYAWDARTLAAHVRSGGADYIVVAGLSKSDLAMHVGDPADVLKHARPYTRDVLRIGNPFTLLEDFMLLQVDRRALDTYLAGERVP